MATLNDLIRDWDYQADIYADNWEILVPDADGAYRGDCDDFAVTALYLISGESLAKFWRALLTRRAKMYFVKVGGVGHAVLECQGRYIDNIQRRWVTREELLSSEPPYDFKFRCWVPFIAVKMALGKLKRWYEWIRRS